MQTNRDSELLAAAFEAADEPTHVKTMEFRFRWPIKVSGQTVLMEVPIGPGESPIAIDPLFVKALDLTQREVAELRAHLIEQTIKKVAVL